MEEYNFDIEQLEQDVAKVLRYSQGFHDITLSGVSKIIKEWFDNKKFFIDHMNGKLIYQLDKPVSFELDEKAKREKLERFAEETDDHYNNHRLSNFLYNLKTSDFYENKTSEEYRCLGFNRHELSIPKNFKVVKAFKFFEQDEDKLKQLQSEASRIIQENVISGYLCFSVHPLDYLSLSENVHNWRSCHALDGEYRSGNLNYMVDPTTIICYLRADKQAILPHFPEDVLWNSKKWRVLLFLSNDRTMMFAGKPYPFSAKHGLQLIRSTLPTLNLGYWSDWRNSMVNSLTDELSHSTYYFTRMIPLGSELRRFDKVVKDGPDTYHFNDLLRSSTYAPIWSYRRRMHDYWDVDGPNNTGCSDHRTKVIVGKSCPCPICGSDVIAYTDSMLCSSCASKYDLIPEDYYECEMCGSMTHNDDLIYLDYSRISICPDCYNRETVKCQECGILDLPEQVKYHDDDTRCLCPACWEEAQKQNQRPIKMTF